MLGIRSSVAWSSVGLMCLLVSGCFNPEDPVEDPSLGDPTTTSVDPTATSSTGSMVDSGSTTSASASGVTTDDTNASSSDGPDPDSTTVGTAGEANATIYDIQDGTVPEGATVNVEEVIVTAVADMGVFVQEFEGGMHSGVFVLGVAPGLAVGDEINLVGGLTAEIMGQTVVDLTLGLVQSTGLTGVQLPAEVLPAADLADGVAEPWEGVLVQVEGMPLTVTELLPMSFTVADGMDSVGVGSQLYDATADAMSFPDFGINASFTSVRGPLSEGPGGYRIQPRGSFDLEGYVSALVPETHPFPTAADPSMFMSGSLPWNGGDYYEGVRMTMLPLLSSVDIHIDVVTNGLTACGFQNAEVILNGVVVGDFTIMQGTVAIDQSYPVPMAVMGPTYTVRYETTASVASGCGAAGYDLNTSTITFNP